MDWEYNVGQSPQYQHIWRDLNSLESQDIYAMYGVLGMPEAVLGSYFGASIWEQAVPFYNCSDYSTEDSAF